MALEIRVTSPTDDAFVEHIVWNADEIAKEVEAKVGYYKNLVYTEDQVAEAKKDRAKLRKFVTALKDKDREIKDLCLKPYEEFHNQMQKIILLVEEPAELIDKQVKEYEEGQKRQKLAAINDLFEKVPPVDKMMDKVNNSLDELGDSLRKFSGEFDRQLDEFTDQMMGKDKKDPQ